jgi:hypothetical protein
MAGAGGEDAAGIGLQVLRFLLGSGVTCGRPSRRTVDSQNISDFDSTSATSAHGRAPAPGSLNPSFNSTVGSISGIGAVLFRVSFDQLIT